jgi:predicted permease
VRYFHTSERVIPTSLFTHTKRVTGTPHDATGVDTFEPVTVERARAVASSWNRTDAVDSAFRFGVAMPSPVAAQIFFASLRAVSEIFIVGALGAVSRKRGWLDATLARSLARFNGTFFLPCLLWTSLSRSVTAERLRELWTLPLAAMAHVAVGLALGLATTRFCRTKEGFRTVAAMSAGFGNSLAMPVVVSRAITKNPRIGNLTFTEEDQDKCVLYLSAYVIMLSALMWSLGPYLFRKRIAARVSLEGGFGTGSETGTCDDYGDDDDVEGEVRRTRRDKSSSLSRTKSMASKTVKFVRVFVNPNVASCILGVLTGIVTPVRDIMFVPGRALSWIGGAAEILADAAIPTVLLVIGSSLANGPDYRLADRRTAVAVTGIRFLILPFITIGAYYVLRDAGVAPNGDDKTFWLIFLMLGTTPTANNMMLQAQMFHDDDAAAAGVGTLLFYQYVACPVLLTGFISWFLAIIDR